MAEGTAVGSGKLCTTLTTTGVMWQTIIHCVFVVSAVGIAWTDRLMANINGQRERALDVH
jgi:uncharacterized membrane protein YqhA